MKLKRVRPRSFDRKIFLVATISQAAITGAFLHYHSFPRVGVVRGRSVAIKTSKHLNMSEDGELDFMSTIRKYAEVNKKNNQKRIDASAHTVLYSPEQSYDDDDNDDGKTNPIVTLFTKETGANEVVQILQVAHENIPHTLRIIDVTHSQNTYFFDRYKYDVPILHMGNQYWTKGCNLTPNTAALSLHMSATGFFQPGRDEPNAAEMERQMNIGQPNDSKETAVTTTTTEAPKSPRRSSNGDFQKQMMPGSCSV